jgi:hypothetical protein
MCLKIFFFFLLFLKFKKSKSIEGNIFDLTLMNREYFFKNKSKSNKII